MNICRAYRSLNKSLLEVIAAVTILQPVKEEPEHVLQVRLEQEPVALSLVTLRLTGAITAHDLSQYRNKFYSIQLEEKDKDSWFKKLVAIGGGEDEV